METAKDRKSFRCWDCGEWVDLPENKSGSGATGYATVAGDKVTGEEDRKICYDCAAERDREWMRKQGTVFAYIRTELNNEPGAKDDINRWYKHELITWAGIVLAAEVHVGRHWYDNFGCCRKPVRFWFEGEVWSGTWYQGTGDYVRARRTKLKSARW